MKTIEERAKEYAPEPLNDHYTIPAFIASENKRQAYIAGATEQRNIDIIRVRQFLKREAAYNGTMSYVDDLLIEKLCKAIEE